MAKVIKKTLSDPIKRTKRPKKKRKTGRRLTREKHIPSTDFHSYVKVIYGDIGVGKTTLALQQPNTHAFMFDYNTSYECYQDLVNSWDDFIALQSDLLSGNYSDILSGDYIENVIIDGLQIAYDMALDYGCKILGIDHPGGMNDYGATWSKIKRYFITPIREIVNSGIGVTFICHATETEIESRTGRKFVKLEPDLSGQAKSTIIRPWPNLFYYHHGGNGERYLQIVGDDYIEAKNRMQKDGKHFMTPDGEPVFKIPMGKNEKEAYNNLMLAFNNKQIKSFQPVKKESKERRIKRTKRLKKVK
jgi:hypothetical protein